MMMYMKNVLYIVIYETEHLLVLVKMMIKSFLTLFICLDT